MNIVFIQKEYTQKKVAEKNYGCSYMVYPTPDLAVSYLAAVAKSSDHTVSIYSYRDLQSLKKNLPKADAYVVHSVYLSEEEDMAIGNKLKQYKMFYFGPSPTLHPENFAKYRQHYVLRGEVEHIFAQALETPEKTRGISFLKDGRIQHNPSAGIIKDIDSIPFPLRDLDSIEYRNPKLGNDKSVLFLASRGCANQCTFCVPNSITWARELEWKKHHQNKPPVTYRSVENIVSELKECVKLGYKSISFIDDQFVINKSHTLELATEMTSMGIKFGILARCDKLTDPEIPEALASAGCEYIDLGVESFNQKVLNDVKKNLRTKDIYTSITNLRKSGIEPKLNIMFGTSQLENKQIIEDSIKATLKLPVRYCMYSIATPYEGTHFYNLAKTKGWITSYGASDPTRTARVNYPSLQAREIEKLTRKAYKDFYFRPGIVWYYLLDNFKSFTKLKTLIRSIINFYR